MVVHDTAQGFSAYDKSPDSEFFGNLSYYNGWMASDRNHGHGMYMQNISGGKLISDNIVGDNADEGMQIYGSGNANVVGFNIVGNAYYNTSSWPFPHYQYNLLVAGGSIRKDIQVSNNYSYFTPEQDYGFVALGQYTSGQDMAIKNNVFVGGYDTLDVQGEDGPVVFTGNTLYTRSSAVRQVNLILFGSQTIGSYSWNNNAYYGLNRFYFGSNQDFAGWKAATGFDSSSTIAPTLRPE